MTRFTPHGIASKFIRGNLEQVVRGQEAVGVSYALGSHAYGSRYYPRFESMIANQTQDMIRAYYVDGKQYVGAGHRTTLKGGLCSDCGMRPYNKDEMEQFWKGLRYKSLADVHQNKKVQSVLHRTPAERATDDEKVFSVIVSARVFMRELNKNLRKNNPRVTCLTYGDITTLKSLEKIQEAKKNIAEAREVQKLGDTPEQKEYSRIMAVTEANLVAVEGKIKKNLQSQRLATRRRNNMLTKEDKKGRIAQKVIEAKISKGEMKSRKIGTPIRKKQKDLIF